MTTPNNDNIEKCFEEIKQVLRRHECGIFVSEDGEIEIYSINGVSKYYWGEEFNQ